MKITTPWWANDHFGYANEREGNVSTTGISMTDNSPGSWKKTQGDLVLGHQSLRRLAGRIDTPFYAYSEARIRQKHGMLRKAADSVFSKPARIYYALKANRNPQILGTLRMLGAGVDTCSGDEIRLALESGFDPGKISFTCVAMTPDDLKLLARLPEISVNCDSLRQIQLLAEASPGRAIGLRINPQVGFGYNDDLQYSSQERSTKFGIYAQDFPKAIAAAKEGGLKIQGLHCHSGWGLQNQNLSSVGMVAHRILEFMAMVEDQGLRLDVINLGGGLGTPLQDGDERLDVNAWAALLSQVFGRVAHPRLTLALEPGDFIVRDCGVLVSEVLGVESKNNINFVVLDASFAINLQHAAYDLPMHPIALKRQGLERWTQEGIPSDSGSRATHEETIHYRIVGAINEAVDIFVPQCTLEPLVPGDWIVFPNVGAYGASMASQHCLRGKFREVFIPAALNEH